MSKLLPCVSKVVDYLCFLFSVVQCVYVQTRWFNEYNKNTVHGSDSVKYLKWLSQQTIVTVVLQE